MIKIAFELLKIANDLDDVGQHGLAEELDLISQKLRDKYGFGKENTAPKLNFHQKQEEKPQVGIEMNMNDGRFSFWIVSNDFNKRYCVFRVRSDRGNSADAALQRAKEKGIIDKFERGQGIYARPAPEHAIKSWFDSHPGFRKVEAQVPAKQPQIQIEPIDPDPKEVESKKEFEKDIKKKKREKGLKPNRDFIFNKQGEH